MPSGSRRDSIRHLKIKTPPLLLAGAGGPDIPRGAPDQAPQNPCPSPRGVLGKAAPPPSDLVGPLGAWGPATGSSGTWVGRMVHVHGRTGWVPATAPEGKTADSGARERPPGHRSGPMGTARTQGTHGVGRQRPGPFGSGQAPPRADHRPPRRLRWPISPSRPAYPGSPGGRRCRLAASRSWGF